MAKSKNKPTEEQRKWFKSAGEEIKRLDKEIEAGLQRKDHLNQTIDLIDKEKKAVADMGDERILVKSRDEQILSTQRLMNLKETLERRKKLSGICRQCGGTGFHELNFGQGRGPLNQPPSTCLGCWGSGWEGTKPKFPGLSAKALGLKKKKKGK